MSRKFAIGQNINLSETCLDYGNVYENTSTIDSVYILNSGTDTLFITSLSTSTNEFSVVTPSFFILAGDSALVEVFFSPLSAGLYLDTLEIFNSDIDTMVCLSGMGIGAPMISYSPLSIYDTLFGCDDSLVVPITIYNTGNGILNISQEIIETGNSTFEFYDGFEDSTYNNWLYVSNSGMPSIIANNPASGNYCLSPGNGLLEYTFPNDKMDYFSIKLRSDDTAGFSNHCYIGNASYNFGLARIRKDDDSIYQIVGNVILDYTIINDWTFIEFKNINYDEKTFDIYIDSLLIYYSMGFANSNIANLSRIAVSGGGNIASYYDDILLKKNDASDWLDIEMDTLIINVNDSATIDLTFYAQNMTSGIYYSDLIINSNDPTSLIDTVPISLTIDGAPTVAFSDTCLNFESIQENSVLSKFLTVFNFGCDTLFISNISSGTAEYGSNLLSMFILPFDSTLVNVTFSPSLTGTYNDTLHVFNNDVDTFICLTGAAIDAPIMSYSPASINETILGCNDSIVIPITINNVGIVPLSVSQGGFLLDTTLISFFDGFEDGYTDGWISVNSQYVDVVNDSPATGSHCVEISGFFGSNLIYSFAPSEADYFSVKMKTTATLGQNSFCYVGDSINPEGLCRIDYLKNSNNYRIWGNIVHQYPYSGDWLHFEIKNIDYTSKSFDLYIDDSLIVQDMGFKVNSTSSLSEIWLANYNNDGVSHFDDIQIGGGNEPSWVNLSSDSLEVLANSSATFDITLSSEGLSSGSYYSHVRMYSNDPLSPIDTIPINLLVDGVPAIEFSDACLNFGSIQENSILSDSITVYNTGCDTLFISSISTNTGEFDVSNSDLTISPFDSTKMAVSFLPTAIGTFNDTIHLLNNYSDTSICLVGTAIGAPMTSIQPDSLITSLDCSDSTEVSFTIYNAGNADLYWSYDTLATSSVVDSSLINYSSTGALTSHTINGQFIGTNALTIEVTLNGDYNSTNEYATLSIEGSTPITIPDNNLSNGNDIVNVYTYSGQTVENWLSDNQLTIDIQNTSSVDYWSGQSTHQVKITIGGASWVTEITPLIDTVPIGDSSVVIIDLNSVGLISGNYSADIEISTNDPLNNVINVPINLTVISNPEIAFSDNCIDYGVVQENAIISKALTVFNFGCDTLFISNIQGSIPEFYIADTNTYVLPWDSLNIEVSFAPASMGQHSGLLNFFTNDTDTSICVSGDAVGAPSFSYVPSAINETIFGCNDSITVPITFYNTGNDSLFTSHQIIEVDQFSNFFDGFEDGNFNNWTETNLNYPSSISSNNPASGNYCVELDLAGLVYNFDPDTIDYFSIKMRYDFVGYGNHLYLGNQAMPSGLAWLRHQGLNEYFISTDIDRIYTRINDWTHFEFKNIDYVSQTYDLYIDGSLFEPNVGFRQGITDLSRIYIASSGFYDDIELRNEDEPQWAILELDSSAVPVNDSLTTNVTLYSQGLSSGVYYSNLIINSNDPLNQVDSIPIVLTVDGVPKLELSDTCMNFGNILENTSSSDSVMIYNTDCDTLFITSITSGLSEFSTLTSNLYIPPFDSTLLGISFSPAAVGTYNTILNLFSNDIDTSICLTGVADGSAVIGFAPSQIDTAIFSCDDSLTIPITVHNLGNDTLSLQQQTIDFYLDSSKFFDGFEVGNFNSWQIFGNLSTQVVDTTNPASGVYCLSMVGGSSTSHGVRRTFNPSQIDYFSIKLRSTATSGNSNYCYVGNNNNNYALVRIYYQSGNNYRVAGSTSYHHTTANNWTHFEFKRINYQTHTFDLFIDGVLVVSGMGFGSPTNSISEVSLFNGSSPYVSYFDDIQIGEPNVLDWVTLSEGVLSVPHGNSTTYNLMVRSENLIVGNYYSNVVIHSNDPLSPIDTIQVSLLVDGEPEIAFSDTCLDFGSIYENTIASDSITIYNMGCDTLFISSLMPGNPHYNVSSLQMIMPFDSSNIYIDFVPTTFGNLSSDLHIYNNAIDTSICLLGTAIGAPIISYFPDSINVIINACNDSALVSLAIINSGNGMLNGNIINTNSAIFGFSDGFEDGTHNNWNDYNNGIYSIITSNPDPVGNYSLKVEEFGVKHEFPETGIDYFSVKLRSGSYSITSANNFCYLGDGNSYLAYMYYNGHVNKYRLRGSTTISYTPSNSWTQVELKNINYVAKTFDVYFDGVLAASGVGFYDPVVENMSEVYLNNPSYNTANPGYFDDIVIGNAHATPKWQILASDTINVNVGDTATIPITYYSDSLLSGIYYSELILVSNDPLDPIDTIPVSLTFNGYPEISLSDSCLSFDNVVVDTDTTYKTWIYNTGCDTLWVSNLNVGMTEYSPLLNGYTIVPGDSSLIEVSFSPTTVGTFDDSLQILSNDDTTYICIHGQSIHKPIISFSTVNEFGLACSDSVVINATIYNNGLGNLAWYIDPNASSIFGVNILDIPISSGVVPPNDSINIELIIDLSSISSGQYIDLLTIYSNDPLHSDTAAVFNLFVIEQPCVDFVSSQDANCAGQIQFTDASLNSPTSWLWDFGDGHSSTLQHPTHTYLNVGNYDVTLTVTNNLGSNTTTIVIDVTTNIPTTTIDIFSPLIEGQPILFGSGIFNATSWRWNFGDGDTSYLQTPTHLYTESGSYTVSVYVVDELGCLFYGEVTITLGSSGLSDLDALVEIVPNPSKGKFYIIAKNEVSIDRIIITNALGDKVYQSEHNTEYFDKWLVSLNVAKGIYYVNVLFGDGSNGIYKLVIQ